MHDNFGVWSAGYKNSIITIAYLRTQSNVEIDLVIERPGQSDLLVEIKSSEMIRESDVKSLSDVSKAWDRDFQTQIWSQESREKRILGVDCLPWKKALKDLFK